MKGRKWLASALLAGMVMSPSVFAEVSTLSDDVLADVSAQGIQTVANPTAINGQENNNDSVQANGNSQSNVSGMQVLNHVDSASNTNTNLANLDSSSVVGMSQVNTQTANNSGDATQRVDNGDVADAQNNNNVSVQINDDSQTSATADIISNSAGSAVNIGQNIANITNSNNIDVYQENSQVARNGGANTQDISNDSTTDSQNNNLASVQLNDNAQSNSSTMVLENVASSAENIAQNIVNVDTLDTTNIEQLNDQSALNVNYEAQTIANDEQSNNQNNNSGSIQVNSDAQTNVSSLVMSNTATSAKNVGQNILNASSLDGVNSISQTNKQVAERFFKNDYQGVDNTREAFYQDNNMNSVQLNDNAQSNSTGLAISNTADSAENIGQNIVSADGFFAINSFSSTNDQYAYNNTYFYDSQYVTTTDSYEQKNNVSSTQLNDDSQNNISALSVSNTASSASNIGQNVANQSEIIGYSFIEQANVQTAENYAYSNQEIGNSSTFQITAYQDNNNGSVQNNDNAQNNINAMAVTNSAASGVNVGQNVASSSNIAFGSWIVQSNDQTAEGFSDHDQYVSNTGLITVTVAQNNNNASTQLNDNSQNNIAAMSLANSAASSVNVGQNVADNGNILGLNVVLQSNDQVSSVWNWENQTVDNFGLLANISVAQNNNNASTQLNDGQNGVSAMSVANSSLSAVNVAQNVASSFSLLQIGGIGQANDQTAEVYNNETFQGVYNGSLVLDVSILQNNNNASVQANDAQNNISAMSLANSATSAVNVAQNVADYSSLAQIGIIYQKNSQVASINDSASGQEVYNVGLFGAEVSALQNNNNAAVQLNNSQVGFSGMSLANSAQSAVNVGQNVGAMVDLAGLNLILQSNDQSTSYTFSGEDQTVKNGSWGWTIPILQNNNNASVQVNDNAQNDVNGMSVANSAASAVNVAQNVGYAYSLAQIGAIGQANTQNAETFWDERGQYVENKAGVLEVSFAQDNNNGSVQVNDTHNAIDVISMANSAGSAVNVGQNIADIGDFIGLDIAYQVNDQYASNDINDAFQEVANFSGSIGGVSIDIAQDNNNGSIQLNNAQNNAQGMSLVNSVASAVNVGQNVANIYNPDGLSYVDQTNTQVALNDVIVDQDIYNEIALAQDNNNGSVQLNDAQNSTNTLNILNSATSATNSGLNIANVTGSTPAGTVLDQLNDQYAENWSGTYQNVDNVVVGMGQDNNNGSVQLNNSQAGSSSLMIVNTAGSAANYGINMASVTGATGWTINQAATQTAINH